MEIKKKLQDSFNYLKSQCVERMKEMTLFDELIKQATEFVEKNREGWDHKTWLDFLSNIQSTGIKLTEEVQSYLGLMVESIKNFNEDAFQKGRKVTDVISEQTAHFIQQTKGIWDHSKWENFVKELTHKGVQVSGETISSLGDFLESAKKLYFSLSFASKISKKDEIKEIEEAEVPEQLSKEEAEVPEQLSKEVAEESPQEVTTEQLPAEEPAKEVVTAEEAVSEEPQQPKETPLARELAEQKSDSSGEPLKTQRLTKKFLMELKEGMFIASKTVDEGNTPVFSEYVSPLSEREEQWKKIVIASANQRVCQVFENEEAYKVYLNQS